VKFVDLWRVGWKELRGKGFVVGDVCLSPCAPVVAAGALGGLKQPIGHGIIHMIRSTRCMSTWQISR